MDSSAYPGKGLSLSQLVFALNQELRRTAYSPLCVDTKRFWSVKEQYADYLYSLALDAVSQLEREISAALVIVRGWMNTFARINCIPLDILSLIPTHLSSGKDRFRASFVCRHWRETFLQHGALWSQLFLTNGNGEEYVKTLLKRAKGSALDITINYASPSTTALLSPHARQIKHLNFSQELWSDILMFSKVNSGSLPLLRTLEMRTIESSFSVNQSNVRDAPSSPLFSGAVNLKKFTLDTEQAGLLKHFIFPNLTTFELSAPGMDGLNVSHLFNFLKASPALQRVDIAICGGTMSGSIPEDMILVLPNVKTFFLTIKNNRWQVYELATHISCPYAKHTLLSQEMDDNCMGTGLEVFPNSASWVAIARQYTTSPVEEITLEIEFDMTYPIIYSLTFLSSDTTVINLDFEVVATASGEEDFELRWNETNLEIFSQACRIIRDHPLLSHVKRLYIIDMDTIGSLGVDYVIPMANVVLDLFRSLGPLDKLTIHGFDLQVFIAPFIDLPEFKHFQRIFPSVKELEISETWMVNKRRCADAILELAKSQYHLEKPFERMTINASKVSKTLAERLRQWVNPADRDDEEF